MGYREASRRDKARFYSPHISRFIQPDTLIPGAGDPQAWNRYSYVLNSSVKYSDPTGHWSWTFDTLNFTNHEVAKTFDTLATICDVAAFVIDATIVSRDFVAASQGFNVGVALAFVATGETAGPIAGPAGAAIAIGLEEIKCQPALQAANGLATLSTAFTALSDLLDGESSYSASITKDADGIFFQDSLTIGDDTYTSLALTILGNTMPTGFMSLPIQSVAVGNDIGYDKFGNSLEVLSNAVRQKEPGGAEIVRASGSIINGIHYARSQLKPFTISRQIELKWR